MKYSLNFFFTYFVLIYILFLSSCASNQEGFININEEKNAFSNSNKNNTKTIKELKDAKAKKESETKTVKQKAKIKTEDINLKAIKEKDKSAFKDYSKKINNIIDDNNLLKNYSFDLNYDIYVLGIKSFKGTISMERKQNEYIITITGQPAGISTWFSDSIYASRTKGKIINGKLIPHYFEEINKNKKRVKRKGYIYNKNNLVIAKYKQNNKEKREIDDIENINFSKNALDPQSLVYMVMLDLEEDNKCDKQAYLFDDKSKLQTNFINKKETNLDKKDFTSLFLGKANPCTFKFKQVLGEKLDSFILEKEEPIIIYASKIDEKIPPVPVKIHVKGLAVGSVNLYLKDVVIHKK